MTIEKVDWQLDGNVYCNHDGFCWVWNFGLKKWLIDLERSGGPPSPHEESPTEPPLTIVEN